MTLTHTQILTNETSVAARRAARAAVNKNGPGYQIPVVVVASGAPRIEGHSFYHTTPSGKTIVHHPNAYKWRTLYHPSTRRIVVGIDWLTEQGFSTAPHCVAGPCAGDSCS